MSHELTGHVFCTYRPYTKAGYSEMKTNWEHQKKAIATDQKLLAEDEHLREIDKRHLKQSEENPERIPRKGKAVESAVEGEEEEGSTRQRRTGSSARGSDSAEN